MTPRERWRTVLLGRPPGRVACDVNVLLVLPLTAVTLGVVGWRAWRQRAG